MLPVFSACVWLGMLLGLLIYWTVDTHSFHYPWMGDDDQIAFISDIGASKLKPLFIAGSAVTTVFLDLSFAAERLLRHNGRLVPNTTVKEKVLSIVSIGFAIIGTAGLILLSIFDTHHHHRLHDVFLFLFIAGYILSAVFICWEYQQLGLCKSKHLKAKQNSWNSLLTSHNRQPPASRPPPLILDKAHIRHRRVHPRHHLRLHQLE
jgi:hypothetical protein